MKNHPNPRDKMEIKNLTLEIAESYLKEFHPKKLHEFENYRHLMEKGLIEEEPSKLSEKFMDNEIVSTFLIPIVTITISSFIIDFLKSIKSRKRKKKLSEINLVELNILFNENPEVVQQIENSLSKSIQDPQLLKNIIIFSKRFTQEKAAQL